MIDAVRRVQRAQRPRDTSVEAAPGIVPERRWLPLDRSASASRRAGAAPVLARHGRGTRTVAGVAGSSS